MEMRNSDVDYNKIDSVITFIGTSLCMRLNVILSNTKAKHYTPDSFYMETEFYSKVVDRRMANIKLTMRYFITIEGFGKEFGGQNNPYIIINDSDMINVRTKLHQFYEIYNQPDVYKKDDNGNVYPNKKYKPIMIEDLPFNKYIVLAPSTIVNIEDKRVPAIKVFLSDKEKFVYIHKRAFEGMLYQFDCLNMYQAAQELLNFYGIPDTGTNRFSLKY